MNEVYQVLGEDSHGFPVCVYWTHDKEEAEKYAASMREMFDEDYFVDKGTEFIKGKCRKCDSIFSMERFDAHGITTGNWCDKCYDSDNYPFRKDKYATIETHGYGERLNDDY